MIAIVITDSFAGGGAERVASLLINGLSANSDNEVHVCVFEDNNSYGVIKDKVSYHLLVKKGYKGMADNLLKIWNLTKTIRRVKPDVVYSFGPIMASYVIIASYLSGMRKKMRIVSSERNDPRREPVSDWKKRIRNYCYSRSDVVVCQTPMAVELLKEYGVKTKFVIIPNPISPNLPIWEGQHSKDIITAARLTEQKNLPMLIQAFKLLHQDYPEYRLVIYGEGELREALQTMIDKDSLSGYVTLPGFAKDIHQVMAHAYMYVSSSDYEGISNSMLEALGIGLPSVCTDCPVGGAGMYIKHMETGILTNVGCVDGLYNGMKMLIEQRALANRMSEASRYINKQLTTELITSKWPKLAE